MKTSIKDKTPLLPIEQNFPIVGIGASAGGLDAFKRLLKAIPENSGMAYVLVQHLDPSHESILPEILSRSTKIPVHEITDDIKLAPDHIYIIPSNKILISTDGVLKLALRDKKTLVFSIDIFLNSLAEVHKELAIGIILSGTGSDGSRGLRSIKEHGGITFAQDSESATFDSMPQSAINEGVVDFVMPPEEIPAQLIQIVSSYKTTHLFKEEEELPKDDDFIFKQILLVLRQRRGVDFTYYKQPTIHRRIARRIAIVKKKNLADYLIYLRSDKAEQDALFQDLLIPVTSFFRDPKTFQTLSESVLPSLFRNKNDEDPFRVWIAGCSTGQEAFSIAICLHEFLGNKLSHTRIQIFASDISENAIRTARTAFYTKAEVQMLSEEQLKNYFKKSFGGYEVNKVIRDMCVFAPHNFLKDPPFAKMDLISCRNVLIYMDNFLQKKALTVFHYALKPNGILLLGKSESTSPAIDLFTSFDKHEKIFSRKSVPGRFIHVATEKKEEDLSQKNKVLIPEATQIDFRKSADAILLSKFTPASVVVNEQMDVVNIQGVISSFLEQPQGKPTFNLLKMAREGLAFELRNALHKAKTSKETVIKDNIPTKINDKQSLISFQVIPLTETVEPHFLIVFEEKILPTLENKSDAEKAQNGDAQKRYEQLEKELSQTREDMRSITEDMEAAIEELQSANEEMQSSNEEMQSLNEELETSREELQSTNEELTIINHELLDKQDQLNTARFYSESIIATLREPMVILNKSLRIITANASFYNKFNTEEQDVEGKLFYEIQNNQWGDDTVRLMLDKILPKKEQLNDFEITLDFPKLGQRHLLLNARQVINEKTAEQLILLAIEDVTDKVLIENKIKQSEHRFKNVLEYAPDGIVVIDKNKTIQIVNLQTEKLFGFRREELIGKELGMLIPDRFRKIHKEHENRFIKDPEPREMGIGRELFGKRKDGREFPIEISLSPLNKGEEDTTILATIRDITKQKRVSEELQEAKNEAVIAAQVAESALESKQQFLSNMSHEIRTPMNAIIGFTKVIMKTDLSEKQKEYLMAIKSSGDTLIVLIDDILDLAKVDAGKMTFMQKPFELRKTISTMLQLFETKIEEKKLELSIDYDDKIPKVLLGDSIRLNQIILNLVSNAVKFTANGKIIVAVLLISEDDDKVTLTLTVKDTGIGIAESKIPNIFQNFQQATHDTSYLYGGTGLGLAIVKQLVEKQGGTISVESKIGEGSTFGFTMSFQKNKTDEIIVPTIIELDTQLKDIKVLVAEDVALNQLLIRTILDDFGFTCDIDDDGKKAVEKLKTEKYDIVLMDLQMPEMNGFEATEYIRNILKLDIPIIALTADVTTMDLVKCKAIGMNDYISKPIDENLLYKKMVKLIQNK